MTHETYIAGYRYYLGAHLVCCHGPVDALEEIRIGGRTAYVGSGRSSDTYYDIAGTTLTVKGLPPKDIVHEAKNTYYPDAERIDRVVLDVRADSFRVIYGEPVDSYTGGTATAPSIPRNTYSLALLHHQTTHQAASSAIATSLSVDETARDQSNFETSSDFDITVKQYPAWSQINARGTRFYMQDGELNIFSGAISQKAKAGDLTIDKPELFGGVEREGGVQGQVDALYGDTDQSVNDYLAAHLSDVPAFRGLFSLVLRHVYVGVIPRLKPWAMTLRREPRGLSGSGMIGNDANPAHMQYEIITDSRWGMGRGASSVNVADFEAARDTLASEGFGLSMIWQDASVDAEGMIAQINKHIDASTFVDPSTGQWRIKLHRDDYTASNLTQLDGSNVITVDDFSRPGWGELANQVNLIYTDGEANGNQTPSWKESAVNATDLSTVNNQGGRVITRTVKMPGVTKADLATRLASRELRQLSQPLARVNLTVTNRTARPGDVFAWSDPEYGVDRMVIRVVEVEYGTLADRSVRIKAVEDIFGLTDALYAPPAPTQWVEPTNPPAPSPARNVVEATYYQVARQFEDQYKQLSDIDDDEGYGVVQAIQPGNDTFGYAVQLDHGNGYHAHGMTGECCPTAVLLSSVEPLTDTLLLKDTIDLDEVETDTWAYIGDEIVAVRSVDPDAAVVTVDRAVMDTVPVAHGEGERIFFGEGFEAYTGHRYVDGETVDFKVQTTTGQGQLQLSNAPADSLTFNSRFIRPYPPGVPAFNNVIRPFTSDGIPTLTWAHRDRTQQTGPLIDQFAGDIGPEPGTTYTVRVYDGDGNLAHTETGISGTQYTYATATELADGGPFQILTFELESVRDGYTSYQHHSLTVDVYGYGRRYGQAYGGLP